LIAARPIKKSLSREKRSSIIRDVVDEIDLFAQLRDVVD
jgi:hypothetical protein